MKYNLIVLLGSVALVATSCKDENAKFVDPNTGKSLALVKDADTGLMVDAESKKPVYIYVDTEKKDTIFGETGKVINGQIVLEDGKYVYSDYKVKAENGEYKIKDGDYKEKMEKDGDIKIKDGDKTIKIDGKTGETKVKKD